MPVVLHDDLWRFDGSWTRIDTPLPRPSARSYHAAARLAGGLIVVFGGANCTGSCVCHADAWLLDTAAGAAGAWTEVAIVGGVDPRYHHSLVARRGRAVTFGGESYKPRYMYHNSVASLVVGTPGTGWWGIALAGLAVAMLGWVVTLRRSQPKIKI